MQAGQTTHLWPCIPCLLLCGLSEVEHRRDISSSKHTGLRRRDVRETRGGSRVGGCPCAPSTRCFRGLPCFGGLVNHCEMNVVCTPVFALVRKTTGTTERFAGRGGRIKAFYCFKFQSMNLSRPCAPQSAVRFHSPFHCPSCAAHTPCPDIQSPSHQRGGKISENLPASTGRSRPAEETYTVFSIGKLLRTQGQEI